MGGLLVLSHGITKMSPKSFFVLKRSWMHDSDSRCITQLYTHRWIDAQGSRVCQTLYLGAWLNFELTAPLKRYRWRLLVWSDCRYSTTLSLLCLSQHRVEQCVHRKTFLWNFPGLLVSGAEVLWFQFMQTFDWIPPVVMFLLNNIVMVIWASCDLADGWGACPEKHCLGLNRFVPFCFSREVSSLVLLAKFSWNFIWNRTRSSSWRHPGDRMGVAPQVGRAPLLMTGTMVWPSGPEYRLAKKPLSPASIGLLAVVLQKYLYCDGSFRDSRQHIYCLVVKKFISRCEIGLNTNFMLCACGSCALWSFSKPARKHLAEWIQKHWNESNMALRGHFWGNGQNSTSSPQLSSCGYSCLISFYLQWNQITNGKCWTCIQCSTVWQRDEQFVLVRFIWKLQMLQFAVMLPLYVCCLDLTMKKISHE